MRVLPPPPLSLSPISLTLHLCTGADITDYFNYGFTEETWKLYSEKQRRMKVEVIQLNKIAVSLTLPGLLASPISCIFLRWYSSCRTVDTSLYSCSGNSNCTHNSSSTDTVVIFHCVTLMSICGALFMSTVCHCCLIRILNFKVPFLTTKTQTLEEIFDLLY